MEDVVKQGFLYLQQQQTFGKVGRAGLGWAGAGPRGWGFARLSRGGEETLECSRTLRRCQGLCHQPPQAQSTSLRGLFPQQLLTSLTRPQTLLLLTAADPGWGGEEWGEGLWLCFLPFLPCGNFSPGHLGRGWREWQRGSFGIAVGVPSFFSAPVGCVWPVSLSLVSGSQGPVVS